MAINAMECPNCGAPIDFGDAKTATCPFCSSHLTLTDSGVNVASTLSDLANASPSLPGVDVDRIRQLVSAGKKIDAIKLVREQTDLGLKEAKDAVDAIERGEAPDLTPRAAASSSASQVDLDAINELLLQNKKIDAIKLYREQTGVGLKEAKDAIEAIEATGSPPPSPPGRTTTSTTYRLPRQSTSSRGCLLGCLPTLLFIGLCAGFIMLSSHVMFRAFGPLDQSLQIINSEPAVVQAFGTPITPGVFVTGEMSGGGSSSSAQFSVAIFGPKRSGDLNVSGDWRKGVWDLDIWVAYDEAGEEQSIYITRQVK